MTAASRSSARAGCPAHARAGDGAPYYARLSARRAQRRMGRIVGTPEYKAMTIRSWTTTTKLPAPLECVPTILPRPTPNPD